MTKGRRRHWLFGCGIPLLLYCATVIPLTWVNRERINPDAVAYLRQAEYLAGGDWASSVSAYWSPMLGWCIAPLVKLGADPLYAAHAVLAAWGAGFIIALHCFLRRLVRWPLWLHIAALSTVALATAPMAVRWITPDLMVSTLLMAHLAAVWHPRLMRSRKRQLSAGALAGLAYVAKSFALPFVLAHLPVLLILRALLHRRWTPPLGAAVFVVLGVLLTAGPWVAVISRHHAAITSGTSAPAARALLAPESAEGARLRHGQPRDARLAANAFAPPPDPRIAWWETPDAIRHRFWSPFENEQFLRHQRKLLRTQTRKGARIVGEFDYLSAGRLLIFLPLLLALPMGLRRGRRARLLWCWLALAVYCAPFLLVYLVDRYLVGVVLPMLLMMGIMLPLSVGRRRRSPPRRLSAPLRLLGAGALCASFAIAAIRQQVDLYATAPSREFRELAAQLNARYPDSTIVSPDFGPGLYTAYFARSKFVAVTPADPREPDDSVADRERLLVAAVPKPVVLIWSQGERKDSEPARQLARSIVEGNSWNCEWTFEPGDSAVSVYRRLDR